MKRNLLDLYLTKVSQGDLSYLEKLALRLADRLLFVPLSSAHINDQEILNKTIPVYEIKTDYFVSVPAFTHESGLLQWCKSNALNLSYASLLGYELCATLSSEHRLIINYGETSEVTLTSEIIERIAEYGDQSDTVESLGTATVQHVQSDLPPEMVEDKPPETKDNSPERRIITLYNVVEEPPK